MDWPKRIVLMRHGESENNVAQSSDDASFDERANHAFALTKNGRRQALMTSTHVRTAHRTFDAFFCSTFRRTQETLNLMFPGAIPIIDSRLNELWRGIWHTMPREKILALYPEKSASETARASTTTVRQGAKVARMWKS